MKNKNKPLPLDPKSFEATKDGKKISLYTLDSGNNLIMQVTNLGGRVVSLWVEDQNGNFDDVVIGYENIDRYLNNTGERYLGTVVGQYANRVANATFILDGTQYQLPVNNGPNCLHGGIAALDMRVWDVEDVKDNEIVFSCTTADGDDGFPGNVNYKMTYTLSKDNEFKISYQATTDKATHINLSHHSFFNLKGEGNGSIDDHVLTLHAQRYLPINEHSIPYGKAEFVVDTPFDFSTPHRIGERINDDNQQLKNGAGYDHCWVIDKETASSINLAATVYEPTTGRVMEVYSDQPGIQFYSSNWFDGLYSGKYGRTIKARESLALETQKFPDTPNRPEYPTSRINPGEVYKHICIYKFFIRRE